jgi:FkbM family methyltransferase
LPDLLGRWRALKRRLPVVERLGGLIREPAYRVTDLLYRHRGLRQTLASGDRFCLHPRFIGWNLAAYEPDLMSSVAGTLREGDVFLDVGAHVGLYSLVASVRVGLAGRVVAFEPSPASVSLLRRHLAWNGCENVQVLEAAVSDTEGSALFTHRADPTDPGGCANSLAYEIERGVRSPVRLRTLDSVCEELGITPRLVKMDVEGSELGASRGGGARAAVVPTRSGRCGPPRAASRHGRVAGVADGMDAQPWLPGDQARRKSRCPARFRRGLVQAVIPCRHD